MRGRCDATSSGDPLEPDRATFDESPRARFLNRGTSPLRLPYIRLRAKRYGETAPNLEERRRALARGDPYAPLLLAWLTRVRSSASPKAKKRAANITHQ